MRLLLLIFLLLAGSAEAQRVSGSYSVNGHTVPLPPGT